MGLISRGVVGSVASVGTQILTFLVTLFLTPIIIGALGKADYGLWILLVAIFGQYELLDFGLSQAMARFFARSIGGGDVREINQLASTVFRIFLCIGCAAFLLSGLIWLGAPLLVHDERSLHLVRIVVLLYAPVLALGFFVRLYQSLLKAHLHYDRLALAGAVRLLVGAGLNYYFITRGYGLIALATIQAGCMLIELALIFGFGRASTPGLKIRWADYSRERREEIVNYSGSVFFAKIANSLRNALDPFLIGWFIGTTGVTYYSIGLRFVSFFGDVVGNITAGPLISALSTLEGRGDESRMHFLYTLSIRIAACFAAFGSGSLIFYGHHFLVWWLGGGYELSYQVMVIASVSTGLIVATSPARSLLYAIAKHRGLVTVLFVGGLANAVLSVILIQFIGLLGVVWGTAIETVAVCGWFLPRMVSREAGVSLRSYYGAVLRGGGGTLLVLLPFFFLAYAFLADQILRMALLGLAQTVWFLPLGWFVVFSRQERVFLLETWRARRAKKASP